MKGLSAKLRKLENENKIEWIKIKRTSPVITHLLFADNCYIFTKIRNKDTKNIKHFLKEFSKALGYIINYEKSEIIFSKNTSN